jgi:aspartate/methionine/tyrosine aminotransferase
MPIDPSRRSRDIPPFLVMDVLERAQQLEREGRSVIHMEVGEPDFDSPPAVREAAEKSLADGDTNYTHSLGLLELREEICSHYHARYGVNVDPGRILVTNGTSPALFLVFSSLLEAGDQVLMTDPHYACYPNFVEFLGGEAVFSPVFAESGYQPDTKDMKRRMGSRTKGVLINSPANPTGAVIPGEKLQDIAGLGVPVVSDEIYHGLVYGPPENTILQYTEDAFVLNGFSKLYAMTGWRLGYVIVPERFVRPMQKVQQNFFISAAAFVQRAGIAALRDTSEDVVRMVDTYRERRDLLLAGLRRTGFSVPVDPQGAFYVLVDARHLGEDSYKLAFDILEKTGVAVTPGIDFGQAAEGYLRFSYANSTENLVEGVRRLGEYVKEVTDATI